MIAQTLFQASPDELRAMLAEAVAPLTQRIAQLESQVGSTSIALTTKQAGERIGYSADTVRSFITKGRVARSGKTVFLAAREITPGDYRIAPGDLDHFFQQF